MSTNKSSIGKQEVYNSVLAIMGGLILVWCIFLFIPMDGYLNFIGKFYNGMNTTIAAYYTTIISFVVIAFEFGFYGIKRSLNSTVSKVKKAAV